MKNKSWVTLILILSILSSLAAINFSYSLYESLQEVNNKQNVRLESMMLADELRQSSDDLTNLARLYVETGNPKYKVFYHEVLEIREGHIPKPYIGNEIYWDFRLPDSTAYSSTGPDDHYSHKQHSQVAMSFEDRMRALNFTEDEFETLNEAKHMSNILADMELQAFKLIDIITSDTLNDSAVTESIRNDITDALFSQEYLQTKAEIMVPVNRFSELVNVRTEGMVSIQYSVATEYLGYTVLFIIVSLLTIIIFSVLIFKSRRKNIDLLTDLNKKNTYLEHAAKILRHDMHSGINVYIPRGVAALDRKLTDDMVEKYKLDAPLKMLKEGLRHARNVYKGVYEFTNLVKKHAVLEKIDCDLKETLCEFLSATSYRKQIEISENLPKSIKVNPWLFSTAIDNLVRNGLKYNDSPNKLVKIYMEDEHLVVEDNGRGMSQKDFEYLSRPYTRKEEQKEQGSGLGLNICNSILEEHGFKIMCEKINTGTKLIITLGS